MNTNLNFNNKDMENLYVKEVLRNNLATKPVLREGDTGKYVEMLQEDLILLGFLNGTPNGIFGFNTRKSVELFQLAFNLPVTGIVNSDMWEYIEHAKNNPLPSRRPELKLGDDNLFVKDLEQRLIIIGLFDDIADTVFDEKTEQAVKNFQRSRNLPQTGIVDPRTWLEFDNIFSAVDNPIPTLRPTIKKGDENEFVELLQRTLKYFRYYDGEITGCFDSKTEEAVIKIQETYNLEPTGIVDYNTWELLDTLVNPTFINYPLLKEGSTAPEVKVLQEKLKLLEYFPGSITGSFGPETTEAVKAFQKDNNLIVDGIVGRQTWEVLFRLTSIVFDLDYALVLGRPTLRYGDSNDYVKELQTDLKRMLFYNGEITGSFDSKTEEAVKAFQVTNRLTADGIVGRQTWSALIYLYKPLPICEGQTTPPVNPPSDFIGIVIDAGHGGDDPGAVSKDIIEKEYNLKISQYMNNRFRELGVPAKMTRTTDETLTPANRIARINSLYGDKKGVILISNHINAGGGEGAETIYALRSKPDLSKGILTEIGKAGQKTRSNFQKALPSDPTKDYYYLMRDTKNLEPVIVEYGFLDNANDSARLQKYWDKYAEATVKATLEYLGLPYTPPQSGKIVYIVRPGDSLWSIANRFNTTVDAIKQLNNLTSNIINVGQELLIPGSNVNPNPPSGNIVYIVKAGDSLWSIANKFNTTVDAIKQLNNLTSNLLSIGQQLFIPGTSIDIPESNNIVYIVKAGDTLYSIGREFNVNPNTIRTLNNLTTDTLSIGQRLLIPRSNAFIYTVVRGDSLWSIANRFGTTVEDIRRINYLTSDVLSVGQELLIPGDNKFIYVVVRGDSLWSIAQRFNTTVDELMRINNLTSTALSIGQELFVPRT